MTDSTLHSSNLDTVQADATTATAAEGALPDEELTQASGGFELTDPCSHCGQSVGYYPKQIGYYIHYLCNNCDTSAWREPPC